MHLRPTAELAERALLPDDPGQALSLASLLFGQAPLMFNHHRGLWGYTGVALDGEPLTVQSTGIGGASAAVVVAELAQLGLRRAVRVGRAWRIDPDLADGALVAAREAIAADGTARTLGSGERAAADPAMTAALAAAADTAGTIASSDVVAVDPSWAAAGALAFDLETAAVLTACAAHGIRAGTVVAIAAAAPRAGVADDGSAPDGSHDEHIAERLGRAAVVALAGGR